ncbi:MAG: hypothetical protein K5857_06010 [Lachnospiraceae bacterium]|nr:hypothetical protein [Lachnospiraceae bacterium]
MITLYVFAALLSLGFTLVYGRLPDKTRLSVSRKLTNERIVNGLKKLEPARDLILSIRDFADRRVRITALSVTAGLILAAACEISSANRHELLEGNAIKRNDYLAGSKDVRLKVRREEDDSREDLTVRVSDLRYGYDELNEMAGEAEAVLTDTMLSGNPSFDEVTANLNFPGKLEGYPFKISFRTTDPLLLDRSGVIRQERFEKLKEDRDVYDGVTVGIHAELTYEDFIREIDLYARIYPADMKKEMTLSEYLEGVIKDADEEGREEEYLILPSEASGSPLVYEEKGDNKALILLVMTLLAGAGLYMREGENLKKRVEEREKELISDYPALVNKFLLFYSAGLTTRGIVARLCREYRTGLERGGDKRYLYEELLICEGHMNEGMGEITAYEAFAAGCGIHKYRHFISLITQAIGKGRSDLIYQLERETQDAFADRKNRARELGEEAGTKLLFPMLMMLLTVLIIVMVPAFISFRF